MFWQTFLKVMERLEFYHWLLISLCTVLGCKVIFIVPRWCVTWRLPVLFACWRMFRKSKRKNLYITSLLYIQLFKIYFIFRAVFGLQQMMQKVQRVPIYPFFVPPHTHSLSPLSTSPTRMYICYNNEPMWMHHCHPECTVYIRVHSSYGTRSMFWQMYDDIFPSWEYHTDIFTPCKSSGLCLFVTPFSLATIHLFIVSIILPFPVSFPP